MQLSFGLEVYSKFQSPCQIGQSQSKDGMSHPVSSKANTIWSDRTLPLSEWKPAEETSFDPNEIESSFVPSDPASDFISCVSSSAQGKGHQLWWG